MDKLDMSGLDMQKAMETLVDLLGEQEGYDIKVTVTPKEEKKQEASA